MDAAPTVVLVRDLMFLSKIASAARSMGVELVTLRDAAKLTATPGARLIVDLSLEGAIESASLWKSAAPGRTVVGFVSHIDSATINAARSAGIEVLSKGQFSAGIDGILAR
jgi:hypothetical protein